MTISTNIRGNNVSIINRIRHLKYSIDLLYGGGKSIEEISREHSFNPAMYAQVLMRVVHLSDRIDDLSLFRHHRGLSINKLSETRKYKLFWLEHIKKASVHWRVDDEINEYIQQKYKPSDFLNEVDPNSLDIIELDRRAL